LFSLNTQHRLQPPFRGWSFFLHIFNVSLFLCAFLCSVCFARCQKNTG
jgi:hypothetical protein